MNTYSHFEKNTRILVNPSMLGQVYLTKGGQKTIDKQAVKEYCKAWVVTDKWGISVIETDVTK